jgi:hypothetical protein
VKADDSAQGRERRKQDETDQLGRHPAQHKKIESKFERSLPLIDSQGTPLDRFADASAQHRSDRQTHGAAEQREDGGLVAQMAPIREQLAGNADRCGLRPGDRPEEACDQ